MRTTGHLLIFLGSCLQAIAQNHTEYQHRSFLDLSYLYGTILIHNKKITDLVTGDPQGVLLSWSRKSFGSKEWQQRYNYPDYGVSFLYSDLNSHFLGENYGLCGHYSFYFLKRDLMLRVGTGLAITTRPYDKEDNPENIALGTRLLSASLLMVNYKKERLLGRFGIQTGLMFTHYSSGNVKSPNTGINSLIFNLGVNYQLQKDKRTDYEHTITDKSYSEPVKFNVAFRTGVNEGDRLDSGQFPLYVISAYADKRFTFKSGVQMGAEIFFSNFLKEFIRYQSINSPESGITGDEDYKRVGVFGGYQLFINRLSAFLHLGYYVYFPVDYDGRVYTRLGIQYQFSKHFFTGISIKAHEARAEAVELSLGYRF